MKLPIYLDYAATTPIDPDVCQAMLAYMKQDGCYGNPASAHVFGAAAKQAVDDARQRVAALLQAEPAEIIWTSGATEANNLALKGVAALYQRKGKHIVTVKTEHPSVLDTCQELEKQGFQVTYLTPNAHGLVDLECLKQALRADTILVSIMHVNNEVGVIQDIQAIADLTAERGILFHTDAAQSAGKLAIDVRKTPVDLVSLCAHKFYGPKGMGALYIRRKPRVRVAAIIHGGGQEMGMRSGTLPVHQIVGMGEAAAIANARRDTDYEHMTVLRDQFMRGIQSIPDTVVNGDLEQNYPGIINICFQGIDARAMLKALPTLAMSVGSACHSKGVEASSVLRAMGLSEAAARSSIRFSFGRYTNASELDEAIETIKRYCLLMAAETPLKT